MTSLGEMLQVSQSKGSKALLVVAAFAAMLLMAGCGDNDSPTGPSVRLVGATTWRMEVTDETITADPFDACAVTDVGLEFLIRIEPVTSKSFTVTITQSGVELTGTGNIRGSEYRFSAEGTEMGEGMAINVRVEGTLTMLSETVAGGYFTYEYGGSEGGASLCEGKEKFVGTRISLGANPIAVELPGGATMGFVWIEPGTFMMGSPVSEGGRYENEGPRHEVVIGQGFYLGKYEITQGQWEAVMGTTPWSGKDYVRANPNHPAVDVSWDDVQAFIEKLNVAAGEEIYRLPSEAEWEYACRAGTETRWSFGDVESQLGYYAWYAGDAWNAGLQNAQLVGMKLPNPWGVYDMHGNVGEWVQDW